MTENIFDSFGLLPSSYSIGIELFIRLLGAMYIIAYVPFLFQIRGLLGEQGILPISHFLPIVKRRLGKKAYFYVPTILWMNCSDKALFTLIWTGIILGSLLLLGIYPLLMLALLYLIHLSLTSAGQDFLGFGWESYLMELTVAAFLVIATTPYNILGWIGLNLLLLRFFFQAGASKLLSRDENWRNLTAISYHYLTQPLPNTIAWYFHKFPMWFHKMSCLGMFFIELVVPLLIFSPPIVRLFVFSQFFALQFIIWFTGNLSYLNYLTVVSSLFLIANCYLEPFMNISLSVETSPFLWQGIIYVLGFCFCLLQLSNLWYMFFPNTYLQKILAAVEPFHLSVPHGIFAIMTTKRYEIIIEGSQDGITWHEYEFFYKPGVLSHRPRRISPYQPRIDWQAWFLPFRPHVFEQWFHSLLYHLLLGSDSVSKLLKYNPFTTKTPLYIRALVYDYTYTSKEEKAQTGNWWKRELKGEFIAPLHLVNAT